MSTDGLHGYNANPSLYSPNNYDSQHCQQSHHEFDDLQEFANPSLDYHLDYESQPKERNVNGRQEPALPCVGSNARPNDDTQSHTYWEVPAKLVGFLAVGAGLAVGHHFYYAGLSGKQVKSTDEQEWAVRYGTAFAFLVKTSCAAAIATAYSQHIWTRFRKRDLRVATLDSAFSATSNILSLAHREMISKLPIATLLAALIWLLPLPALFTPATLSVMSISRTDKLDLNVPTLNFSESAVANAFGGIDYGINGSPALSRVFSATYSGANVLPMEAIIPDAINATYDTVFHGPLIRCRDLNASETLVMNDVAAIQKSWSAGGAMSRVAYMMFAPYSGWTNSTGIANFSMIQNLSECLNLGNSCSIIPTNWEAGYFWVYTEAKSWACHPRNATFQASFTLGSKTQTISIDHSKTTISELERAATSEDEHPYAFTRKTYDSIFSSIFNLLKGFIALRSASPRTPLSTKYIDMNVTVKDTSISRTALIGAINLNTSVEALGVPLSQYKTPTAFTTAEDQALAGNKTMAELIEELSLNVTLSYFSTSKMWSASGLGYDTTVEIPRRTNVYSYSSRDLIITYTVTLIITLLAVFIGLHALQVNGVSHGSSFSTIVQTTRNHTLDKLSTGKELGVERLDREFGKTKLRFGVLYPDDTKDDAGSRTENEHVAFGLSREVNPLLKQ
ncbi:hypothetical protein JX266_004148 [Neoarthrinium moseri]|nr:hypothetical protein JX266_004148 [Neoarthrinium moseri]